MRSLDLSLAVAVLLVAVLVGGSPPNVLGQVATGTVRGTAQYEDGKPLGGVWVIIQNAAIGINYKKDSNPLGQFLFEDVYPGTYTFTISPGQFVIRSPQQIEVRQGRVLDVTVVVSRSTRSVASGGGIVIGR
ncbi:MAG TPA: carboxypeptidase-like regulatory domain-containing protein [Terriglobia bacterium]